jgi:hypothetical protein
MALSSSLQCHCKELMTKQVITSDYYYAPGGTIIDRMQSN